MVAKEVTFIVPEISCRDKAEGVWYHEPGPVTRTKEATRFSCTARSSVSCVTEVRPVCKVARWQDCAEVPVPSCRPKSVHVPTQVCRYRYRYYLHYLLTPPPGRSIYTGRSVCCQTNRPAEARPRPQEVSSRSPDP